METYTSPPLEVPEQQGSVPIDRADLVFYDVDHSGPSYTARIFLDNPQADATTPTESDAGFAGSFTVFGHAGCVGDDDDHCNPGARTVDAFDRRMPHPLLPQTKTVSVTAALRHRSAAGPVTVKAVAVQPGDDGPQPTDTMHFEQVRLVTYEHDAQAGAAEEAEQELDE